MNKTDLIVTRDSTPSDLNFILATFLRALYYGDTWFKEIPKDIFMKNYHQVIETLLSRSLVKVACLKEDPEVIVGYAIFSKANPNVLHFTFVKSVWRNIGVMKSLVPQSTNCVTHLTKVGLSIIKKHQGVIFNPFNLS